VHQNLSHCRNIISTAVDAGELKFTLTVSDKDSRLLRSKEKATLAAKIGRMRRNYECPLWVISGHFAVRIVISALPPKADMCTAATDVG
jgi:hypothetical protein